MENIPKVKKIGLNVCNVQIGYMSHVQIYDAFVTLALNIFIICINYCLSIFLFNFFYSHFAKDSCSIGEFLFLFCLSYSQLFYV